MYKKKDLVVNSFHKASFGRADSLLCLYLHGKASSVCLSVHLFVNNAGRLGSWVLWDSGMSGVIHRREGSRNSQRNLWDARSWVTATSHLLFGEADVRHWSSWWAIAIVQSFICLCIQGSLRPKLWEDLTQTHLSPLDLQTSCVCHAWNTLRPYNGPLIAFKGLRKHK